MLLYFITLKTFILNLILINSFIISCLGNDEYMSDISKLTMVSSCFSLILPVSSKGSSVSLPPISTGLGAFGAFGAF